VFTRSVPLLLLLSAVAIGAAGCGAATPAVKPGITRMQFAFFHFKDDQVRVTVDGRTVFDQTVTVAPENVRLGLAAVAQIDLPACSQVVVKTKRQQVERKLCLTPRTKSVVVDGGPPLTIGAQDRFQGAD
jgi:hypothetical protein